MITTDPKSDILSTPDDVTSTFACANKAIFRPINEMLVRTEQRTANPTAEVRALRHVPLILTA
jgi:hypothetical protein